MPKLLKNLKELVKDLKELDVDTLSKYLFILQEDPLAVTGFFILGCFFCKLEPMR